jgi:hypothetical protein
VHYPLRHLSKVSGLAGAGFGSSKAHSNTAH